MPNADGAGAQDAAASGSCALLVPRPAPQRTPVKREARVEASGALVVELVVEGELLPPRLPLLPVAALSTCTAFGAAHSLECDADAGMGSNADVAAAAAAAAVGTSENVDARAAGGKNRMPGLGLTRGDDSRDGAAEVAPLTGAVA